MRKQSEKTKSTQLTLKLTKERSLLKNKNFHFDPKKNQKGRSHRFQNFHKTLLSKDVFDSLNYQKFLKNLI